MAPHLNLILKHNVSSLVVFAALQYIPSEPPWFPNLEVLSLTAEYPDLFKNQRNILHRLWTILVGGYRLKQNPRMVRLTRIELLYRKAVDRFHSSPRRLLELQEILQAKD